MKKILIRPNVFETNSSSCHSLSIADDTKEFVMDTIYPNQDGIVTIYGGEFGWEWFKHNDAQTKADYAAQMFYYDETTLETIKEVIMEQTGAEDVIFKLEDGYIDHDSHGIVPSDKDSLRNFIFNKNSWLFGGNDNSTPDPTFYHVPEIKDGKMILPKYKYELKIEGLDKSTKFIDKPTDGEFEDAVYALLGDAYVYDSGFIDTDNNIWAQINRTRDYYRLDLYDVDIDRDNCLIPVIKNAFNDAKQIWEQEYGDNDWNSDLGYRKCREIAKGLYEQSDSPYVKYLKYQLTEI